MNHDPASQLSKSLYLDDLPVDVFDVGRAGLTVESLTGGHGMTETGASFRLCSISCICSCSAEQ